MRFYQTRSNAIILQYPESCSNGTGEVIHEKVYASPRPPPKISLKHDWMKELGSEVARQPEGEVARQAKGSQPTQPNLTGRRVVSSENTSRSHEIDTRFSRDSKNANLEENANHDRTETPVVCSQNTSHTRFSRDSKNVMKEEEANHDRTVRPVVCSQTVGSPSMLNEVDIDFRISGLPHSVVKKAKNSRVRELVKKIENHPHRQDLQADLQWETADDGHLLCPLVHLWESVEFASSVHANKSHWPWCRGSDGSPWAQLPSDHVFYIL